ncbi:nuclear transport factor 2 family protein [Kutzneria sp. NPDC052558]|uniref:nuclear transport factor 2 family protein n=1 Tax=Kutzneria sp. NPDC052558 TaxID=3364121 RepID=UPI0037C59771
MTAPAEVFRQLVDGVVGHKWDQLPLLYAEDAVVTHPFSTDPAVARLEGRAQIREHFAQAAEMAVDFRAEDLVVHQTTDPEVIVGEYTYRGSLGGQDIAMPMILVVRVRDGLIVESRDYTGGR